MRLFELIYEVNKRTCVYCWQEIDPDCCGCGSPMTHLWDGHGPIPMGCICGYDEGDDNEV